MTAVLSELKATKWIHADGQPANFKIYRQYHERLQSEGGRYGFAVYRIRGRGAQVLETEALQASNCHLFAGTVAGNIEVLSKQKL